MATQAPGADLLLVHDPELLLVLPPKRKRPPTVWDVHEDTAAALTTKAWLPTWLRPVAAAGVISAEHLAERRLHLILAEHGYNARFKGTHPVVPNTTYVPAAAAPPGGPKRVVYVGHISPDRGSAEMTELGRLLKPHGIAVDLVGPADAAARAHIEAAGDSMPTKVAEYMARGVPVISTPLPLAVKMVEAAESGFVVPFNAPEAAAEAILRLDADPDLRVKMGLRAHDYAQANLAWPPHAAAFVTRLEAWAAAGR
jgi:glycosyltransferase involved in cell wall biosynthesis